MRHRLHWILCGWYLTVGDVDLKRWCKRATTGASHGNGRGACRSLVSSTSTQVRGGATEVTKCIMTSMQLSLHRSACSHVLTHSCPSPPTHSFLTFPSSTPPLYLPLHYPPLQYLPLHSTALHITTLPSAPSLPHSPTHSLTHSLTDSLTHSLTHCHPLSSTTIPSTALHYPTRHYYSTALHITTLPSAPSLHLSPPPSLPRRDPPQR